jgi:electron transfer flavoprotein beta subunit
VVTARVLAEVIKTLDHDIIFCGKQAVDDDCVQVGGALAEFLDLPQVGVIVKLEVSEDKKSAIAHMQVEGGTLVFESPLPAVFTTQKGLNEPRYPSLPGIMKARKKEIKVLDLAALGLSSNQVGEQGAKVKVDSLSLPQPRQAGTVLEEEPQEAVKKLVQYLRAEAKLL